MPLMIAACATSRRRLPRAPTRLGVRLADRHRVAHAGVVVGGRQAARPGAYHQHPFTRRRRVDGNLPAVPDRLIAKEPLDGVDPDGRVQLCPVAGVSVKAATASSSAAVTTPWPPRPWNRTWNMSRLSVDLSYISPPPAGLPPGTKDPRWACRTALTANVRPAPAGAGRGIEVVVAVVAGVMRP